MNPQSAIRNPQSSGTSLFIDPGSRIVGWAVFDGPARLVEAGRLVPSDSDLPYAIRVAELLDDIRELVADHRVRRAWIEIPSARGAAGLHGESMGHGLTVYGFAAGAIWCELRACLGDPENVTAIDADTWTTGWSKAKRRLTVASQFPAWRDLIMGEVGVDMGDAIALGLWKCWGGVAVAASTEVRSEK